MSLRLQSFICLSHLIPVHLHQKQFPSVNDTFGLKDAYCNLAPYYTEHGLGTGNINTIQELLTCSLPDLWNQNLNFKKILSCLPSTVEFKTLIEPMDRAHWIFSLNDLGEAQTREGCRADMDTKCFQAIHAPIRLQVSVTPLHRDTQRKNVLSQSLHLWCTKRLELGVVTLGHRACQC